jgi:hypothetical protein
MHLGRTYQPETTEISSDVNDAGAPADNGAVSPLIVSRRKKFVTLEADTGSSRVGAIIHYPRSMDHCAGINQATMSTKVCQDPQISIDVFHSDSIMSEQAFLIKNVT